MPDASRSVICGLLQLMLDSQGMRFLPSKTLLHTRASGVEIGRKQLYGHDLHKNALYYRKINKFQKVVIRKTFMQCQSPEKSPGMNSPCLGRQEGSEESISMCVIKIRKRI